MLESVKIQRRQSELRQNLAQLAANESPSDDETRSMQEFDSEYSKNEIRFRAALTSEDSERSQAGAELESRSDKEFSSLIDAFELRQVALHLDEGVSLSGQTAEVVNELRSQGGYRGTPIPYLALEQRAGETIASGVMNPLQTRPIIDRIFPGSVAGKMGAQVINVGSGATEYPVVTSSVTSGWAATETGDVTGPTVYATTDKAMSPDNTLGITMKITRKSMKQSGDALEQAIRRDMSGAIAAELDKAAFLGTGATGQPLGVITGAATYGITSTAATSVVNWSEYRDAIVRFLAANAANSFGEVKILMRPEAMAYMDSQLVTSTAVSEYDRLIKNVPASNICLTSNALATPTGSPAACNSLLTTSVGGVSPLFIGLWGSVDLIRDPYSDAASGGLRVTALSTVDVTVARPAQLQLVTGLEVAAA